jgi:hypothetical protein
MARGQRNDIVRLRDRPWDELYAPVPESGCWIWLHATSTAGYGQIQMAGKLEYAHRLSYERAKGPIPAGMLACHRCDTPSCVNPDHIFVGTESDNRVDMHRKGRWVSRRQRLSLEQVREVDRRLSEGEAMSDLARSYGVVYATIQERIQKLRAGKYDRLPAS